MSFSLFICLLFAITGSESAPKRSIIPNYTPMRLIGKGFWNIRVPFQMILVEIGTHMSVIELKNGNFLIIDTVVINDQLKNDLDELTQNGTKIEAVLAVHPFHTLAYSAFYKLYPNLKYYGTPRHLRKLTEIKWAGQLDNVGNKHLLSKWAPEVELRIPDGAEYFNPRPEAINHFVSVFVYHRNSKTLHVDDTLIYIENPTLPINLVFKPGSLIFHPTMMIGGLHLNAKAPLEFRDWMKEMLSDWDFDNLCTAHIGSKIGGAHTAVQQLVDNSEQLFQSLSELHTKYPSLSIVYNNFAEPVGKFVEFLSELISQIQIGLSFKN